MKKSYEKPVVRDYGDLLAITQASGSIGAEDGGGKVIFISFEIG
jgi:hypothetical protein